MVIGIETIVQVHEGKPSKGNPTHVNDGNTSYRLTEADISIEGGVRINGEPEVQLEFRYDDNPAAYRLGRTPETVRLNIPLSVWAGIVANIREKRKNPDCWVQ